MMIEHHILDGSMMFMRRVHTSPQRKMMMCHISRWVGPWRARELVQPMCCLLHEKINHVEAEFFSLVR